MYILDCFKTPGCVPKCWEQIQLVYDTTPSVELLDPYLARVALPEKSGDNAPHDIPERQYGQSIIAI